MYVRELYRLLNDKFGAGFPPFSPVSINTITCQHRGNAAELPTLEIPADTTINHQDMPYSLGKIVAYDASGRDISDSAVAVSDNGGTLFRDGQDLQLRMPRHGRGVHRITVTVHDADGLSVSKIMRLGIE